MTWFCFDYVCRISHSFSLTFVNIFCSTLKYFSPQSCCDMMKPKVHLPLSLNISKFYFDNALVFCLSILCDASQCWCPHIVCSSRPQIPPWLVLQSRHVISASWRRHCVIMWQMSLWPSLPHAAGNGNNAGSDPVIWFKEFTALLLIFILFWIHFLPIYLA